MPRRGHQNQEEVDALGRLRALLATQPREFSLNLAVCPSSSCRDGLIRSLRDVFDSIDVARVSEKTLDLFSHVHDPSTGGPRDALFVVGMEEVLTGEQDADIFLRALDASPRRFKAWYPYPVVFWVDEDSSTILLSHAKDFWEWQTGVFRFDGPGQG
ncbi:MAG: hypothetical protein QGG73_05485 [Candidatus Hydrogenedentes bacterium]|nr:hypothetical protein [Candidatus Hydrogenedentota bacterium]